MPRGGRKGREQQMGMEGKRTSTSGTLLFELVGGGRGDGGCDDGRGVGTTAATARASTATGERTAGMAAQTAAVTGEYGSRDGEGGGPCDLASGDDEEAATP